MNVTTPRTRIVQDRARLRAQGLKPMIIWVPDPDAPGFAAEARRQSLLVSQAPDFADTMDFIERNSVAEEDDFAPAEIRPATDETR